MSRNVFLSQKTQLIFLCLLAQEGREGAKVKCKEVAGGYCLCYAIFPFPVGIFLRGRYKQHVSGCEK